MKTRIIRVFAAAVVAIGLGQAAWADETITENITLSNDTDWTSKGVVTIDSGVTVDLAGHTLRVAGLAGSGTITSTFVNLATDTSKATCSAGITSVDSTATAGLAFESSTRVIVKNENGYWPFSVTYDFGEATMIDHYRIVNWRTNLAYWRAPGAWDLYGSDDNDEWTKLDSQTNVTSWTASETKSFDLDNPSQYRYIKIKIYESASPSVNDGNYIQFLQLQYGRCKGTVSVTDANSVDAANLTISDGVAVELSGDSILTADRDLGGLGASLAIADGVTIDMNGHDLTVGGLFGAGTITDTAAFADLTGSGTASSTNTFYENQEHAASYAFEPDRRVIIAKENWPLEITYDFGVATQVDSYSIISAAGTHFGKRAPGVWKIFGSNDAESWVCLDRRKGDFWTKAQEARCFDFANSTTYRYYKIRIDQSAEPTADQGGFIEFRQLQYGCRSKLNVNIPGGVESVNSGVTLAGNLRLVKDGDGSLAAQKTAQTYLGGTVVAGGTLICGAAGSSVPLGAGKMVGVTSGGTVELNGQLGYNAYRFALAGGTLKNSGGDVGWQSKTTMVGDICLFADSSLSIQRDTLIGFNSNNPIVIDLGGHTLDVSISRGKTFRLYNATVNDGIVTVGNRGVFLVGGIYGGVTATNVDFVINSLLKVDTEFKVQNYEAKWNSRDATLNGTTSVYGEFKPTSDYFVGCTLMDGATLDLSSRSTVLNAQSEITGGARDIAFYENATIAVSVGDRILKTGDQLVAWTAETKPANVDTVRFVRVTDGERKYTVRVGDDGLYYEGPKGLVITIY